MDCGIDYHHSPSSSTASSTVVLSLDQLMVGEDDITLNSRSSSISEPNGDLVFAEGADRDGGGGKVVINVPGMMASQEGFDGDNDDPLSSVMTGLDGITSGETIKEEEAKASLQVVIDIHNEETPEATTPSEHEDTPPSPPTMFSIAWWKMWFARIITEPMTHAFTAIGNFFHEGAIMVRSWFS